MLSLLQRYSKIIQRVGKCKKTQEHFDQNVWVVFYFGRVRGALWQRWQSLIGDEIDHHDHIGVKGSVFLEDKLLCLPACINRISISSAFIWNKTQKKFYDNHQKSATSRLPPNFAAVNFAFRKIFR